MSAKEIRELMYKAIDKNGIDSKEALYYSQLLDPIITKEIVALNKMVIGDRHEE